MGITADVLNDVRTQIDADPEALGEARNRLRLVRDAAAGLYGSLRTYASGSLAAHTMINPVSDGDGGVVLDRRFYPALGPEGGNEPPFEIVEDLCELIGPRIRVQYPNARIYTSKRGPKVTFGAPVCDQNPTVDLVVALTRKEGSGLWIPNLKKNTWEPSDPEGHVALLNSIDPSPRSIRRKVIRLAKAWNMQFVFPGVSSFQLSVWAHQFVNPGMGVAVGLHSLFSGAASMLESHQATPDPLGVSANLKLLRPVDDVRRRLRKAADGLAAALENDTSATEVRAALNRVFWNYVDAEESRGLAAAAQSLARRQPVAAATLGLIGSTAVIPATRSYGEQPR
ncbi:hypothetical protein CQ020_05700 [Arthrobacter sp. MYb23]|uniref:hypothetical protein n=1 Tax=unclassified Arthrobacter TaxID=235627 RepID=UPI000CFE337B|nr:MULTISPECIES: hypothetical protein [unclassified Arthrobacter]PRB42989.1 hypothetical protein CQ038_08330 [Arthrobacter sp. MYb51]PRB97942.1 hypothetical protein CQ020_05700 [Arthrobacter sp. MYb23]